MKNGGGGVPANNAPERLLKKICGFTLLLSFKNPILSCYPEGGARRIFKESKQKILRFAQNDVVFKIWPDVCHPEDEVRRISKQDEQGILRFAQNDMAFKIGTNTCPPEGGARRRKKEMLKRVQHDKDSCVILNLFQDLRRKSKKSHIDLSEQEILRQEWRESLPCASHAQNDKAFKIGTIPCHPEGEARRIYKNIAQGILHFVQNDKKCAFTLAEVLITLGIIGIVMAMTLPSIIGKYQKKVTVERLKKVYSVISQAVELSVKDHEEVEYWDFELSAQDFMDTYLSPYFQKVASEEKTTDTRYSKTYALPDGTTFKGWMFKHENPANHDITTFYQITIDINGEQKPNQLGRDTFIFYLFPIKSYFFNGGAGNIAKNVPRAGLYPDGYGFDRDRLKEDTWRGCNRIGDEEASGASNGYNSAGSFCTALIMMDGWEIADDYKW